MSVIEGFLLGMIAGLGILFTLHLIVDHDKLGTGSVRNSSKKEIK